MDEVKGLIFHIIHGSFVDGYGTRTTVFLKGCPLRCRWCCNPEGQNTFNELKFISALCNGCGKCISVCQSNAIHMTGNKGTARIEIDRSTCSNCFKCVDQCHYGALDRWGKYYTVEELFNLIKKDEVYYRSSGGGVTIGGGEPTLQTEFTSALLNKLKKHYIHTALDTCGYTPGTEAFKLMEEADLLLYDVKGMDSGDHLRNTGVSNETIIRNLRNLDDFGKSIIIRLPLVPGLTESDANIKQTAIFLSGLKHVERIDLLPYHEYGRIKYDQLGRKYDLKLSTLSQERLKEIKSVFERYTVVSVQIGG
jgi:pyruvate formate lyase activating enzyme